MFAFHEIVRWEIVIPVFPLRWQATVQSIQTITMHFTTMCDRDTLLRSLGFTIPDARRLPRASRPPRPRTRLTRRSAPLAVLLAAVRRGCLRHLGYGGRDLPGLPSPADTRATAADTFRVPPLRRRRRWRLAGRSAGDDRGVAAAARRHQRCVALRAPPPPPYPPRALPRRPMIPRPRAASGGLGLRQSVRAVADRLGHARA